MHEHLTPPQCKHELKYCEKCDVVYCELCKKEWVKRPPYSFEDVKKKYENFPEGPWHTYPKIPMVMQKECQCQS